MGSVVSLLSDRASFLRVACLQPRWETSPQKLITHPNKGSPKIETERVAGAELKVAQHAFRSAKRARTQRDLRTRDFALRELEC